MTSNESRFICEMRSGLLYLAQSQLLRGYCILEAVPQVASINDLEPEGRTAFLMDMTSIGDVLIKVTGAYRINYALMGNNQPILHAHIVPRYENEPAEYKHGLPWSYPDDHVSSRDFNPVLDGELIAWIRSGLDAN